MKHGKKFALMFISSFVGMCLLIVGFGLFSLQSKLVDRALKRSDYVNEVHQELLVSVGQILSAYGLDTQALDTVFTLEVVGLNIDRNLNGLESIDLNVEVIAALHDEIERLDVTFTQEVEEGMQELSDKVMGNFSQRTRFPLQGTIAGLMERLIPLLWGLGFVLLVLMILFIGQVRKLARREQNTVILSILGSWLVLLGLWVMFDLKSLVFEPISLKNLILAMHGLVFRDGLVFAGILIIINGLRWLIINKALIKGTSI